MSIPVRSDLVRNSVSAFAGAVLSSEYIQGMTLWSDSTTTYKVGAGAAVIPFTGTYAAYAGGTITPTLAANTWYHVYFDGASITTSTTAPGLAVGLYGSAYVEGTDYSKRYLGSFRTNASSQIIPFMSVDMGNSVEVHFLQNAGSAARIITAGNSTSPADVSLTSWAPAGPTRAATFRVQNIFGGGATGTGIVQVYSWRNSAFGVMTNVPDTDTSTFTVPTNSTPKIQYDITNDAKAYFDLLSYIYRR